MNLHVKHRQTVLIPGDIIGIAWSPNGAVFATTSETNGISIWDADKAKLIKSIQLPASPLSSPVFSPSGTRLAVNLKDGLFHLYDVEDGSSIAIVCDPIFRSNLLAWAPNRESFAVVQSDNVVSVWDSYAGASKLTLRHSDTISSIAWSPDSSTIACAGGNAGIVFWNAAKGALDRKLPHIRGVTSLAWSPDRKNIACGLEEGGIYFISPSNGEPQTLAQTHSARISGMAFSHDGRLFASESVDGRVCAWSAQEGNLLSDILTGEPRVDCVDTLSFSPLTTSLAVAGSRIGGVHIHDLIVDAGRNPVRRGARIFFSYSHRDEKLRQRMETALGALRNEGKIIGWSDRKILPGMNWKEQIDSNLKAADIVLLLITQEFLNSDYCYGIEMEEALNRHRNGLCKVVPVILRPSDWQASPFAELQALPRDAKPVMKWSPTDDGFLQVARGIRILLDSLSS